MIGIVVIVGGVYIVFMVDVVSDGIYYLGCGLWYYVEVGLIVGQ